MSTEPNTFDFREKQIQLFVESQRPPEDIRDQLDLGFDWENNVFLLHEIRPDFRDPKIIRHHAFAKARYIISKNVWKIYWMRASGKWESYPPHPQVDRLDQVFKIIEEDEHGCFKG